MKRREFIITTLISFPALAACSSLEIFNGNSAKAVVVRAGDSRFRVPTPFKSINPNDLKLSTKDTAGRLSAFWYKGLEKSGPSYHAHPNQDEFFYVLEGEYLFKIDGEKQILRKGDLIFLPKTIPHTWVQITESGQMFYFLQPAGKMEEFFLLMTQSGGKLSKEEKSKVDKDHGIINYGPGISPADNYDISEKLSHGFIVRNGYCRFDEKIMINGKSPNDIKVSAKDSNGELSIFEYSGREKGGPPLHIHHSQDEIFYVSAGNYVFQCGEEKYNLSSGDMIFLPRKVAHSWAQLSDEGQLLFFFQPCGKMEEFFRAISDGKEKPKNYDPFKEHGMEITGPPLVY